MSNVNLIDPDLRDETIAECLAIWEKAEREKAELDRKRKRHPIARIWDGDWKQGGVITGYLDLTYRWVMNNTGSANLKLPFDHHIAKWCLDHQRRGTLNIHMTVDKDGTRWGGRAKNVSIDRTSDGTKYVEVEFLDDYEEVKYYQVWPNPFTPAAFQFPKTFILAGPSRYMLKLSLFVNLMRQQSSIWHLPDDPLDPASWAQGLMPWNWSKVIQPGSFLMDDSQWCILHSRFKNWHDMAAPILEDAGLVVKTRRWLEGDELPYPGAIMRNGQLMIDIVDKAGVFEQTSHGGTIAGGLVRTITKHADNLVDEVVTTLTNPVVPAEYTVSKLVGTHPQWPWVVFRDGVSGVESSKYTWTPATAVQFNGGGQSAPGVNEGIEMSVKLAGNLFFQTFTGIGGGGEIANTALEPLYKDVLLAFYSFKSVVRSARAGWDHYFEQFIQGGGTGYTLSAAMALRSAMWRTRTRESLQVDVGDGGSYLVGEQGQGHFFLGDRIGVAVDGLPDDRIIVEQVQEAEYTDARDKFGWKLKIGERSDQESPVEMSLRHLQSVFGALQEWGAL